MPGESFKHFSSVIMSITDSTFLAFIANIMKVLEHGSYEEAKNHPGWIAAMDKELQALEENNTWEITELPKGKKAIGSKWVYKAKLDQEGNLEKRKGRVVAIGYQQVPGKYFKDTFSPVSKLAAVRILIALVL